ncbi:hypothetical protein [uncultured Nostoc sp.]|uniref:hypothetical protein n=1 Tax=uncultured Nostoc sp. TaxID=340711 RepID=UPI0035CC3A43
MKLLIIDTETTADIENTPCEISATLYEVGDYLGAIAGIASRTITYSIPRPSFTVQ